MGWTKGFGTCRRRERLAEGGRSKGPSNRQGGGAAAKRKDVVVVEPVAERVVVVSLSRRVRVRGVAEARGQVPRREGGIEYRLVAVSRGLGVLDRIL